jgi:protein-L-isoaspartate(D-aspartate) O-methyltransferase
MNASQPLRTMMVDTQVRPSDVTKFPIIAAMLEVPREEFVPPAAAPVAYMDAPVPLVGTREMPDARTLAKMLDALDLTIEDEVLIIGGSLGYSAAVLARMTASVVMVEEEAEMAAEAEATLAAQGVDNAAVLHAPLTEGAPKAAPFDVIVVEGGVETVPEALTAQLGPEGRIAALFQQGAVGQCRIGYRAASGRITWRYAFDASAPVLPGFAATREFML